MNRTILFCVGVLLALANATAGAAERWQFDEAHTQVLFTVNHLGFTDLIGQFRRIDGELLLDRDNLSASSVRAVLDAGSVDLNHEGINEHLRNPDFFDVERYAQLRFESTSVEALADDRLAVTGALTMLGHTRPVVLEVTVNRIGNHPMSGQPHAGFTATGTLKRSEWGMDHLVGPVGDEIAFRINVEAKPAAE